MIRLSELTHESAGRLSADLPAAIGELEGPCLAFAYPDRKGRQLCYNRQYISGKSAPAREQ